MTDPLRRWGDAGMLRRIELMEERLERGDSRMGAIEADLKKNTEATAEVLEIVRMGKGFFKVLGFLGNIAKWLIAIGTVFGAVYAAINHKGP